MYKYDKGDLVWFLTVGRKVEVSTKLEKIYGGPYLIKERVSKANYVIQLDKQGTERLVSLNKLKQYEEV